MSSPAQKLLQAKLALHQAPASCVRLSANASRDATNCEVDTRKLAFFMLEAACIPTHVVAIKKL